MSSPVLTASRYESADAAERALAALRGLAEEHVLELKDAAVVAKDGSGRLDLRQTRQTAVGDGIVAGGTLGLVLGLILGGPVGGALVGMAGGAGVAARDIGIPDARMRRLGDELEPGQALLVALVDGIDPSTLTDRLTVQTGGEVVLAEPSGASASGASEGSGSER